MHNGDLIRCIKIEFTSSDDVNQVTNIHTPSNKSNSSFRSEKICEELQSIFYFRSLIIYYVL